MRPIDSLNVVFQPVAGSHSGGSPREECPGISLSHGRQCARLDRPANFQHVRMPTQGRLSHPSCRDSGGGLVLVDDESLARCSDRR